MSKESVSDRGEFRCLSEENCARTVRVIRAYSLIFPAPSLQESFFFREGALTLRIRPPGCRVDIKEIAARWQAEN